MRTTRSMLFALRKPQNYQSGEIPIYLRITVEGQCAELAVGRKCDPERWDAVPGRAIVSKTDSRTLNSDLDDIQFQFMLK